MTHDPLSTDAPSNDSPSAGSPTNDFPSNDPLPHTVKAHDAKMHDATTHASGTHVSGTHEPDAVSVPPVSTPTPASDTLKADIEALSSIPAEDQPVGDPARSNRHTQGWPDFLVLPAAVKPYQPLIALVAVALAGSAVVSAVSPVPWMSLFMGFWLVLFALVKLFDVTGFAEKFARYDLVTARYKPYALAYPFIELGLGLALLGGFLIKPMLFLVLVLACVTLAGIVLQLANRKKFECACMGALLAVPLSTVTVVENLVMIVMSVAGLAR